MIQPALSQALSLGDADLKSHLGEPLNARISINDTDPAIDVGCFTVTDNNEVQAFRKAATTLNQNSSGLTLVITTYQVISEPIVNLSVTYQCEPRVNREYVLLLDPAPIADTTKLNPNNQPATDLTANQRQSAANQVKGESAATKPAMADQVAVDNVEQPVKKPRAKKKKAKKPAVSVEQKLAEAYTGTPQSTSPTPNNASAVTEKAAPATSDKPYLVISGGNSNAAETGNPNLALRMETELDLNRSEAAPPLSTTETMDEVTVMANRLAHLEKQILSLQSQNQQLQAQAAAEKAKNDSAFIPPALSEWLPYIGLGALLLLILAGIEALRRKWLRERLERHEAVWFDAEADDVVDADTAANDSLRVEPKFAPDPLFADLASQQSAILTDSDTDEIEGVLEHAEVFIAHGRTVLAIQLLQNHLTDFPNQSPTIWLKLLSLLANEGLETEYDVAVIECNQFFNIKLPSFAEADMPDDSTIEDHPHIVDRLEGAWGSPYAITLLNDLIYNQHAQPREGFARGTFEELFFLKKIAEALQSSDVLENRANLSKAKAVQSNVTQMVSPVAAAALVATAPEASPGFTVSESMGLAGTEEAEPADKDLTDSYSSTDFEEQLLALRSQQTEVAESFTAEEDNIEEIQFQSAEDVARESDGLTEQDITFITHSDSSGSDTSSVEHFGASDFNTGDPGDFQVSEIDFPLEIDEAPTTLDTLAPTIQHLDEMTFSDDFAEALEFDQEELKPVPKTEPEKPKENPKNDDSNVIEFDWDLPKIDKD